MMRDPVAAGTEAAGLRCPRCGREAPPEERFCPDCRLPLVLPGAAGADHDPPEVSERHARARKIKPQLAEGPLVRVAGAANQAEGEMLQGLLLEAGVPSLMRRSAGFDVPDFLAAGPRDVLVPRSGAATAREVLLEAEIIRPEPAGATGAGRATTPAPVRLFAGLLLALIVGAIVIALLFTLLR